MSAALYVVGYLFLIGVISYLAYLSHIPDSYIFAMGVILVGIGVMMGLESGRQKDTHRYR